MWVIFASGSRLREIGEERFSCSARLRAITIPSSVEILGDRCFEHCPELATVDFEEISKLKEIGERAFASSGIRSITLPASVNEMDGSAFAGCSLGKIDFDPGNRRFVFRGNTLLTWDETQIVKSFGVEGSPFVPMGVEVLKFESGSKLRRIGRSALWGCDLLRRISLPTSLSEIDESAFEECIGLEDCSLSENSILVKISQEAFAGCISLRLFYMFGRVLRKSERTVSTSVLLYLD
jgi:hypothetical protein